MSLLIGGRLRSNVVIPIYKVSVKIYFAIYNIRDYIDYKKN
jgi:hypothetical protein